MLEGVISMIREFATFLPDMDLAINVNDEPRVTIPFGQSTKSRQTTPNVEHKMFNEWSAERAESWPERYVLTLLQFHVYPTLGVPRHVSPISAPVCLRNTGLENLTWVFLTNLWRAVLFQAGKPFVTIFSSNELNSQ